MANWRKQQGQSHHHVGHWRSSSYNRKPPLGNWQSTVPAWEKKFCSSIGLVPWWKLVESKKYMHLFEHIVNWDDTAGKEAFDNAKARYWAEINGLECNLSVPDPDMYIDDVDWEARVDPELYEDLESEAKPPTEEVKNEVVLLGGSLFVNEQRIPPTGWGDDEADAPKPSYPNTALQVWQSNLQESNVVAEPGLQQYYAPVDYAKEYEWQHFRNDPWRGNRREHYGRGRHGGNGNWGGTWEGYNRRRENMSSNDAHNGNEYHNVNRGRRNYRGGGGGRRGNFVYVPKEVPSPAAM